MPPPATGPQVARLDKEATVRQATERLLAAKSRMLNINSYFSGFRLFDAAKDVRAEELAAVGDLIQDGAVQVVIDSVHELRDIDKAHKAVEGFHAAGKVVVRIRKPWERESVQNFKLAPEGSEDGPQEAASPVHSPQARSPSASVPTCSLGPQIVDRESITKKLTAGATSPKARGLKRMPGYPAISSEDDEAAPGRGVPGLPPGWEFAHDEEGVIYYYSHALNISQYEHPATGQLDLLEDATPTTGREDAGRVGVAAAEAAPSLKQQPGSRSSGFLDDLVPPQPPESLGLPLPADEFDDDGAPPGCVVALAAPPPRPPPPPRPSFLSMSLARVASPGEVHRLARS
jgi:hypothetical protein